MCYEHINILAGYLGLQTKVLNEITLRIRLFEYYSNRYDNLVKFKTDTKKY